VLILVIQLTAFFFNVDATSTYNVPIGISRRKPNRIIGISCRGSIAIVEITMNSINIIVLGMVRDNIESA
jgi:hypothetical protein